MTSYFMDSSALVKRYISERGSVWISDLFAPSLNNEVFISAITGVEIISAITRRVRSKSISTAEAIILRTQFKNDMQTDYQIIEVTENIISSGMMMAETYELRGYDAIQLAAGYTVNTLYTSNNLPPVIFVSADNELNRAASSAGLILEYPNNYP